MAEYHAEGLDVDDVVFVDNQPTMDLLTGRLGMLCVPGVRAFQHSACPPKRAPFAVFVCRPLLHPSLRLPSHASFLAPASASACALDSYSAPDAASDSAFAPAPANALAQSWGGFFFVIRLETNPPNISEWGLEQVILNIPNNNEFF